MQFYVHYRLMKTNHETVRERLKSLFGDAEGAGRPQTALEGAGRPQTALEGAGGPQTAAALEGAVRECLGLCWMRRRGRSSRTA